MERKFRDKISTRLWGIRSKMFDITLNIDDGYGGKMTRDEALTALKPLSIEFNEIVESLDITKG